MNERYLLSAMLLIGLMPVLGPAQSKSAFCPAGSDEDAIVTICNAERGMVMLPQPHLYLRVRGDGTAEYERASPSLHSLVTKTFVLTKDELDEMSKITADPDLMKAKAEYPRIHRWTDSSLITTLAIKNKAIVLNNYSVDDDDNKRHYPRALIALMQHARDIFERATGVVRPIPTISYCELLKNRQRYLGKTVAVYANIEYTVQTLATGEQRGEHEFLFDTDCDSPTMGAARTAEHIGVGYLGKPDAAEKLRAAIKPIRTDRYGGRGRVLIAGKVAEGGSVEDARGYPLRFDISEVRSLERVILPFEGEIKLGWFYSDTIQGGPNWTLSRPFKMPLHHAVTVEWANADRFPILKKKGLRAIVFRSMTSTSAKVGDRRWNTLYLGEIVEAQ